MRLGELKSAIRKLSGNPFVRVQLGPTLPAINIVAQKTALLQALDATYPGGKTQETGLTLDEANSMLMFEGSAAAEQPATVAVVEQIAATEGLLTADPEDDILV